MMARLDWRKALVYTHRWLGIAGGLLVLMWFATGIVMIYHRMPEVGANERLERLRPIDPASIRIAPAQAAAAAGGPFNAVRLTMLGERPVYRFGIRTVFADTGEGLGVLSADEATALAGDFSPSHRESLAYDAYLTEPDQWTLQTGSFPLHRIALSDEQDTHVYVSERSGEIVMRTTGSGRAWGYAGAVLHWLYFTPLRVRGGLWSQTIIWLSIAGCLLTLSGLLWGLMRFAPFRRHRKRGRRSLTMSPYVGLLAWHHYAGLLFGFFSFTWLLSGGLSMEPWNWHPGTVPTSQQRDALSLGPLSLDGISAGLMRQGIAAMAATGPVHEIEILQVRSRPYLVGREGRAGAEPRLVSATAPAAGVVDAVPVADLIDAAAEAMPGIGIRDMVTLEEYDSYYYDRTDQAPLPVLRVSYADPQETALYIDLRRGVIVRKEERLTRVNRWLYHGFHSLDFPFLYASRPLWDVIVIVLSLGGIALCGTTLWPGWQRLSQHVRRHAGR
ncbi:MAG: PepSY domain-containing protein [Gemmatimonadota bacterium]|nr:PepSY domain-containing protein [Gemmatimonadota bacterium]